MVCIVEDVNNDCCGLEDDDGEYKAVLRRCKLIDFTICAFNLFETGEESKIESHDNVFSHDYQIVDTLT